VFEGSTHQRAAYAGGAATRYDGPERRHQLRLDGWFLAVVHGQDRDGQPFQVNAEVANISAGGLYLRIRKQVDLGAQLSLVVRIMTPPGSEVHGPLVVIRGRVLRAEPQTNGRSGLALAITHYEFLNTSERIDPFPPPHDK